MVPAWLTRWSVGTSPGNEQRVAALALPSGAIIACDPLVGLSSARPFTRTVAPGSYDVLIGRVDGDIAYAFVRFTRTAIATWEVARCEGDATTGVPGFGVDAGTAAFVDATVGAARRAWQEARVAAIAASITVDPADATAWHEAWRAANEAAPPDPLASLVGAGPTALALDGGNLVAFPSGAGDGVYPAFWGLDASGAPVVLAIDFGLLDDDEEDDDDEVDEPITAPSGPPPLEMRARALLEGWEKATLVVLKKRAKRDVLIDALIEQLIALEGTRDVGEALSEWLLERPEIDDVFATDDELEATLAG